MGIGNRYGVSYVVAETDIQTKVSSKSDRSFGGIRSLVSGSRGVATARGPIPGIPLELKREPCKENALP